MKKMVILISCLVLAGIIMFGIGMQNHEQTLTTDAYIRIHIRANSNDNADQAVKLKVKESVVEFLTPIIAGCQTVNEAHQEIKYNLMQIKQVATETLSQNGFYYGANVRLNDEYFPTRAYDNLVLSQGVYDALIIELGSGIGDNWWCVVYPPLCFIGEGSANSNELVFKSKIIEILKKNKIF